MIAAHLLEHAKLLDGRRVHGDDADAMAAVRRLQAAGVIRAKPGMVPGMSGPRALYVDVSLSEAARGQVAPAVPARE